MKRTTTSLVVAGFLLATATLTGVALARDDYTGPPHMGPEYGWMGHGQMPYGAYGHRGMGGLSYLADELDLSEEQRKTIRDIMDKTRTQARDLGDKLAGNRAQMDKVLDDKGYGADFDKLARSQGELIGQMIILRAKTHAQIEGVLTADQKERFRDYADEACDDGDGPGYGWRGHGW